MSFSYCPKCGANTLRQDGALIRYRCDSCTAAVMVVDVHSLNTGGSERSLFTTAADLMPKTERGVYKEANHAK